MKRIKFLLPINIFFISIFGMLAQDADPILFSVNDNPVHLSEFNYIYNKNNGDKANYNEASIKEYLDLYTKFKLKVQKAKDMKLDTIPVLINELAGYRKQLADTYLTDKEVTERLTKEVYDRQGYDVKVRHILVKLNPKATNEQQIKAKASIDEISKSLASGGDFLNIARLRSQDVNTKRAGGELNYLSAMLPDGYYEFENAMYSLKKGEISKPVKSNVGYHIIQLVDKRPARGKIEAAQILLRKKSKNRVIPNVKGKIDSIYQLLVNGADFETLAKAHSQDGNTASNGGKLDVFGISTYETTFEDAAFGLEKDGDFSKPVETSIGWHIIKRISKPARDDYEKTRRRLQAQIRKDSRYEIAKTQMIAQIKKDANLEENLDQLTAFTKALNVNFYSYKWKPEGDLSSVLFTLGGKDFQVSKFADYCKNNSKKRLRFNKSKPVESAVNELYNDYLNEQCLKYEEDNLENKYPDFKALMREYEEGILLFEATKINVWDKASQDTAGLRTFYNKNKKNYVWKERADLETYIVNTKDEKIANKVLKFIKKNSADKVLAKFNSAEMPITVSEGRFERGDLEVSGIKFKANGVSDARYDMKSQTYKIRKITRTTPSTQKTLGDARGYIIADYQDSLDKEWITQLKKEYKVEVNESVLNNLIKK